MNGGGGVSPPPSNLYRMFGANPGVGTVGGEDPTGRDTGKEGSNNGKDNNNSKDNSLLSQALEKPMSFANLPASAGGDLPPPPPPPGGPRGRDDRERDNNPFNGSDASDDEASQGIYIIISKIKKLLRLIRGNFNNLMLKPFPYLLLKVILSKNENV